MSDPFARQVASYYAGNQYSRQSGDTALRPQDEVLRKIAMASYNPKPTVDRFSYVAGLSTPETAVYIDPYSKQAVVAFRGSKTVGDFVHTDAALAIGQLRNTTRYHRSGNDLLNAKQNLKGYDIYTTGHSLGGKLGEHLSDVIPTKGNVAFNPGKGLDDTVRKNYTHSRAYVNRMDPVSYLGRNSSSNRYYTRGYLSSAHRASPYTWFQDGT